MKIRHTASPLGDKVEQNMTPMIDVVFQLLAFFMFTLKIASVEGNFNIKMPSPSRAPVNDLQSNLPVIVKLQANPDGSLRQLSFNGQPVPNNSMAALRSRVVAYLGNDRGVQDTAEVQLDCDYDLQYSLVIDAITHVSGYIDKDGAPVKLIEKIRFTPAEAPK